MVDVETSSKVELHWALFDSAFHTPTGSHWTWYSEALDVESLDTLYYEVLVEEIRALANVNPASAIRQGFASIDDQWCCWFRLFDGGRDNGGRPGRFLIVAAFAKRPLLQACDAQQVFGLLGFAAIEAIREDAAPLPTPKSFVTSFRPLPFAIKEDAIAHLESGKSVLQFGNARALASACATSPEILSWSCIELANAQSAKLRVVRAPRPAMPEQDHEQESEHIQPEEDAVSSQAEPLQRQKRRWGIWLLSLLGVVVALVLAAAVVQRRWRGRLGRESAVESGPPNETRVAPKQIDDAKRPDA